MFRTDVSYKKRRYRVNKLLHDKCEVFKSKSYDEFSDKKKGTWSIHELSVNCSKFYREFFFRLQGEGKAF